MNTQQTEKQEIFKNIETTGKKYINQFKILAEKAQKSMANQMNMAKFEATYTLSVEKEQRKKTMFQVKEIRNDLWKEALKQANGDVNVASNIYDRLCSFP
ncbi:hypothetical protein J4423_01940 [Candidatus Pacearchaeota archaeon]|nr:hypothetical protein [Candidatus Pacearchaeota archaeon]